MAGSIRPPFMFNGPLYRYLDEESHAYGFLDGSIMLSTLSRCRSIEDPNRRDSGEATYDFRSGRITGNSDDREVQIVAERMGIHFENVQNVTIDNCRSMGNLINDAYLLCMTHEPPNSGLDKFGPFCIEIVDLQTFFLTVLMSLHRHAEKLDFFGNPVLYANTAVYGTDALPGPPGFYKHTRFADEREWRMMFVPTDNHQPKPRIIECGNLRHCVRMCR